MERERGFSGCLFGMIFYACCECPALVSNIAVPLNFNFLKSGGDSATNQRWSSESSKLTRSPSVNMEKIWKFHAEREHYHNQTMIYMWTQKNSNMRRYENLQRNFGAKSFFLLIKYFVVQIFSRTSPQEKQFFHRRKSVNVQSISQSFHLPRSFCKWVFAPSMK